MTTASKIYVQKSVTAGLDDVTLEGLTDAAKKVGAPKDASMSFGGPVLRNADEDYLYAQSVTFSWSEEV